MRGRMMWGIALGIATTLGGGGCAASAKRADGPIQFRQWKPQANAVAAKEKEKEKGDETFPVTAPVTGPTASRHSIWKYRPGSLLFGRKPASTPAVTPITESAGSLSRYFPGLSGLNQGNPLRFARSTRAENLSAASPVLARRSVELTGRSLAATSPISVLPVGLRVETTPKAPPASLPDGIALTNDDEEPKATPAVPSTPKPVKPISPGEQLTSHEASGKTAGDCPDPIDSLSLDLQVEPRPAPKIEACPAPAPVDPASKPTESVVEIRSQALGAEAADRAVKPQLPPNSPDEVPESETKPQLLLAPHADPARPPLDDVSSKAPRPSPDTAAVLQGRPRLRRVEPMELPPAEFPATYHTQSISRVLKEDPPVDVRAQRVSATPKEPRRSLFPLLSRLMKSKEEVDTTLEPASNAVRPPDPSPTLALSEPGQVPEWWQAR